MRVRLMRNIGDRPDLKEGAEADINDAEAEILIRRGLAEKLLAVETEDEAEVHAVPESDIKTVPRRRRKRKGA